MAKLTAATVKIIEDAIHRLFDKVQDRFLGPYAGPRRLIIGFNRDVSLPGIYASAHINERGMPSKDTLNALVRTASNYLDGERQRAKAQVINAVQAYFADADRAFQDPQELQQVMGAQIADVFGKLKTNVARIVDTETNRAKNTGSLEGIIRANQSMNIEDPVVFFIVVRDNDLCDECERLHLMPDGITPRLWYVSECTHSYHVVGDDHPSVGGEHPLCRCVMTTLMPGFGFEAGRVVWKQSGHSEIDVQRGT